MSTVTEHTPDLEIEEDGQNSQPAQKAGSDHVWWMFRTPAGANEDDIRAALELVGADFRPDEDQVAVSDGYNEFHGGMTSADGETAVNSLYDALDDDGNYRKNNPGCRSFADLSRAERQEFMDEAVGCYSFVSEGNFNDTGPEVLAALLAILTGPDGE